MNSEILNYTVDQELAVSQLITNQDWRIWDAFVDKHPFGSIYHTSSWKTLIQEVYGHQSLYFVLSDLDGNIIAGLPLFIVKSKLGGNRLSSLPAAQACNPLVENSWQLQKLLNYALNYLQEKGSKYIELKIDGKFPSEIKVPGNLVSLYSCYILNLKEETHTLEKKLHQSCIRRVIKKATKKHVQLRIGKNIDDVEKFYELFSSMRKNYGLLPQPLKFFKKMWEIFSPTGKMEILHAIFDDKIISSIILLKFKDTVIYEYGASDPDYVQLGGSPFVLWEGIKLAKFEGFEKFDFGRTSNENEGLTQFKQRWNTTRLPLYYYYIPEVSNFGSLRQRGVAQKAMYYTIRYTPRIFGEFLGQVLYKNFV